MKRSRKGDKHRLTDVVKKAKHGDLEAVVELQAAISNLLDLHVHMLIVPR